MKEYEQKICNIIDNLKVEMRYQCDRIQEQAYKQGYKQGYVSGHDHGKQDGYEDGQKEKPQAIYEMKVEEYNKGLNESWECAKKLCQSEKYGGLQEHCAEIFGREDVFDVFDYTAAEAIAKIKAYEDKQNDWRGIPSDKMTLEQARRAVKELRAKVLKEMRGAENDE